MANLTALLTTPHHHYHHHHHHHHSTPLLLRPYPIRSVSFLSLNPNFPKPCKFNFTPNSIHNINPSNPPNSPLGFPPITPTPIGYLLNSLNNIFNSLKKPTIVAILLAALLMYRHPDSAMAASGGRMGGSSFSSSSSYSSSSSDDDYYSRPSSNYSTSSYSYYSDDNESSRPSPTRTVSYSVSSPTNAGQAAGDTTVGAPNGPGSPLIFPVVCLTAVVLVSWFLLSRKDESSASAATAKTTSVIILQVGLSGNVRSIQSDLNKIAEKADTSTPAGLRYVLTETTLSLLRHSDYCISAYSSVDVKKSIGEGEKRFKEVSIEERGKFDEETLVNVDNIKRQSTKSTTPTGVSNEYIVITILVAAAGVLELPTIDGIINLKKALQKLGSIPSSNKIRAVEVLWTPQEENDTLSEKQFLEDYPLLKPLQGR